MKLWAREVLELEGEMSRLFWGGWSRTLIEIKMALTFHMGSRTLHRQSTWDCECFCQIFCQSDEKGNLDNNPVNERKRKPQKAKDWSI